MKVKGLRWWIIGLIGLSTIINYIDRSAINILWPYIYKEFAIPEADNKQALAFISSFFMVAYALGQTLTGKMMDQIGTRLGMSVSIVGWSISIALHAVARGVVSFSLFRFLLGLSEAGNWPGATKSNAEWFPARQRGLAQGLFGASASLGSVVAAPVIVWLFLSFGWRITFLAISILGILWLIPWLWINKAIPRQHPWITEEEKRYILEEQSTSVAETAPLLQWRDLLKMRAVWGILMARFCIDPIWWLFVTWLPTFLKEQFAFDIKQIGSFAWMPFLAAAVGGLLGGYWASHQIKRGANPIQARMQAIGLGCLLMLVSLLTFSLRLNWLKDHVEVSIGLICITLFGFQFLIGNLQTLPSDLFNGKNIGVVSGMSGTAAVLGTLITTLLVPILTASSYLPFFAMATLLVPMAWLWLRLTQNNKND